MTVYLSEYIDPAGVSLLKQKGEIVTTFDHIEDIDAIIVRSVTVSREMMMKAKKLKVIGKHGVGYNQIDIEAAKELGIRVVYTPGQNSISVSEMIVGLMLDVSRKITHGHNMSKADKVLKAGPPELTGVELAGKTIALIGLGNVARQAVKILKNGFGMKIIGYDSFVDKKTCNEMGVVKYESIDEILPLADYVSISVPLTDETKNMISTEQLKKMKNSAILINTARGGIVDEKALFEALSTGEIAGAGFDVFINEPPSSETPLMQLPNFVGTPHVAGTTKESLVRCAKVVVEDVFLVLDGKEPHYPVV